MVTAELGDWLVEADPDANQSHYARLSAPDCVCDHCANWRSLGPYALPGEVREFVHRLGVDVLKPEEVYEMGPDAGGGRLYGGWYHVSGRIVRAGTMHFDSFATTPTARLPNGFRFVLEAGLDGPRGDAVPPRPHLTLWFAWAVPWTLDSPPE
jgi:hypothetical protein